MPKTKLPNLPGDPGPILRDPDPMFKIGDRVRKKKGSSWQGHICGTYSTSLNPEGYVVESERELGSAQLYPASALELVQE